MSEQIKIGTVAADVLPSDGAQFAKVTVTPAMAREWLGSQMRNRRIKAGNVKRWAQDMREGRFNATVQPLIFDVNGRLIDGQNRLTALIEADVSLPLWVAVGVPSDDRARVDLGTPRSAADVLSIEGIEITHRNHVVAMARMAMGYETVPHLVWGATSVTASVPELVAEVTKHLPLYQGAVTYSTAVQALSLGGGAWLTPTAHGTLSVLVAWHSASAELWEEYHAGIATGAGMSIGDPRLTLRNSRVPGALAAGTWRRQAQLMASIKVWNAWVRGERLSKIYASSAKYLPMPEVA